jgi:hypothetical protein
MSKVLVLYYSTYGHIEAMAKAVAEGAREAGAKVDIKRVPETVPEEIAKGHHFKLTRRHRSLQSTIWRTMTPLSSEPARALDASRHKWLRFWTRREACGCVVLCTEKWAALSVPLARSMEVRR